MNVEPWMLSLWLHRVKGDVTDTHTKKKKRTENNDS